MRFAHINIVSNDWKALADFYINTFNCKLVPPIREQSGTWLDKGTGLKNAHLQGAHLLLPGYDENGPTLEIYQYGLIDNQGVRAPNTNGYGHIAFEVENVEKLLNTLIANGGKTTGEVTQKEVENIGILTFVYAKDPEGNLIELQNWQRA
ncbi:VOC family protein [Eudoraea chungangensis]|uniref:VOC family protein n=1 Tax=Eudoraea chungangensis TaxID=1481905 RepID=UPI0023EB5226|nr:VOC family protein [Eudoraea chungangensis]